MKGSPVATNNALIQEIKKGETTEVHASRFEISNEKGGQGKGLSQLSPWTPDTAVRPIKSRHNLRRRAILTGVEKRRETCSEELWVR